jgi:hypothetical protein
VLLLEEVDEDEDEEDKLLGGNNRSLRFIFNKCGNESTT